MFKSLNKRTTLNSELTQRTARRRNRIAVRCLVLEGHSTAESLSIKTAAESDAALGIAHHQRSLSGLSVKLATDHIR